MTPHNHTAPSPSTNGDATSIASTMRKGSPQALHNTGFRRLFGPPGVNCFERHPKMLNLHRHHRVSACYGGQPPVREGTIVLVVVGAGAVDDRSTQVAKIRAAP